MRLTTSEDAVTKIARREGSRQGPASIRLGERLRQLRVSAGLTQSDLAGDRFSKEYVSQIERGKTRPTRETVEWLAIRLGVDPSFLASGVSADERGRMEATLARAEALTEANEYDEALAEFETARVAVAGTGSPELEARALSGEGWARLEQGDAALGARAARQGARSSSRSRRSPTSSGPRCSTASASAATSFRASRRRSACSTRRSTLAERSGFPCDALRSNILGWRSRCYRRQRDWEAAREDVERALELAEGLNDRRTVAHVFFQASLIAERNGHWLLARTYAERAKGQYEELADQANVGKLLNNLGGLNFLLGKPEQAIEQLKDSFRVLARRGHAGRRGRGRLVARPGAPAPRAGRARRAAGPPGARARRRPARPARPDRQRAARARARAARAGPARGGREPSFSAAEQTCDQLESGSHRAAAWIAQGDLASKRGEDRRAARLYRRAAETLQDFRF